MRKLMLHSHGEFFYIIIMLFPILISSKRILPKADGLTVCIKYKVLILCPRNLFARKYQQTTLNLIIIHIYF